MYGSSFDPSTVCQSLIRNVLSGRVAVKNLLRKVNRRKAKLHKNWIKHGKWPVFI